MKEQVPRSEFSKTKLVWISLDRLDIDLDRFLAYIIAAWQNIQPLLGVETLPMVEPPPAAKLIESVLSCLIDDFAPNERV